MRILLVVSLFGALNGSAIAQTATEQTLYSFSGGIDGASPNALILASDGNFYGTSSGGGAYGWGNIFKVTPSGTFTNLHSFTGLNDGAIPRSNPIQFSNGNFYGTASEGGNDGVGTIYQVTAEGNLTTLYSFTDGEDGANPAISLIPGANGQLYGSTQYGGPRGGPPGNDDGWGTIFQVSPSGSFESTIALNESYALVETLIQDSSGTFAGSNSGGVFSFPTTGPITSAYSSASLNPFSFTSGLVEGQDELFYAIEYGPNTPVTTSIISLTVSGTEKTIYSFSGDPYNTYVYDDNDPGINALFLASDGNLYGSTTTGGEAGYGSVFRISPSGTFTTIYSFADSSDGNYPSSTLLQGVDGNLYGVATGGTSGQGVIFKITLSPALPAPIALSLSSSSVSAYTPITLSWVVPNAVSLTMQQCYAFVQGSPAGAGTWTGLQTGAFSDGVYFGSSSITPTAAGTYTYALTCGGVESGFATLTVTAADRVNTTTSLTASPNPATVGQTVSLSSKVAPTSGSGIPTGTVSFYYAGKVLTSAKLNGSGVASYNASTTGLPAGSYSITAKYSGDANNSPSTSAALSVVLKAAAETALTASPSVVTQDSSTTLSAQVSSQTGTPSGKVTFYSGGQALGTGTLNASGTANFTATASVPKGKYLVTAVYAGDSTHGTATSQPITITVE